MNPTHTQFENALEILTEKLKQDRNILAAFLFGSLSHDTVWEKSDIDLFLVTRDMPMKGAERFFALTENDVNIHASLQTRSSFKKMIEGSLRNSFIHSSFSKSRLLFSRDETLQKLYEDAQGFGQRDQQTQLFRIGASVLPLLYKAEKFCYIKRDPHYSFIWITYMYPGLAKIETFLHHEIAGREVIHQALKLNPDFFEAIYTQLIDQPKTLPLIESTLKQIDTYLEERIPHLFQPVLDFLAAEGITRSATEIEHWLEREMNITGGVSACEWLADKGVIDKLSHPLKLTPKSLTEVEELAFYHES